MKLKSKTGVIIASLHVFFAAVVILYSFTCSGTFCKAGAWLAILPWVPLLIDIDFPFSGYIPIITFAVIDTVLIYIVSTYISSVISNRKK